MAALTTIPAAVAVTRLVALRAVTIAAGPVATPSGRSPTAPAVKRTRQTWAGSVGNPNPYITIRVRRNAIMVKATTINSQPLAQPRFGEDAETGSDLAIAKAIVEQPKRGEDRQRAAQHRPRRPDGDHPDRGRAERRQDRRATHLEYHDRCVTERDLGDGRRLTAPEAAQQSDPCRHRGLPLQGAARKAPAFAAWIARGSSRSLPAARSTVPHASVRNTRVIRCAPTAAASTHGGTALNTATSESPRVAIIYTTVASAPHGTRAKSTLPQRPTQSPRWPSICFTQDRRAHVYLIACCSERQ